MNVSRNRLFIFMAVLAALAIAAAAALGPARSDAGGPAARQEVGKVYAFQAESPHPVPNGWSQVYTFTGAEFVRLHFKGFHLAVGDRLVVSSLDGVQSWTYTGRGANQNGDFWSFAVDGEAVKVELFAPSGKSYGFKIADVGYGTVALDKTLPVPEVVCGTDGREDIACHMSDPVIAASQAPVARLLFTVKRTQYVCTGELVRGAQDNLLITNNHCIDSQTVASTLEARFYYQYTECRGTTLASYVPYAGGTFLKTNDSKYNRRKSGTGLDYTLLTLQGNPEAVYGELVPTTAGLYPGDLLNFIQHPGGQPKEIGYWDDADHTMRCSIATVDQTYGTSLPNSQIGYGCDSEGGSSGSAITRPSDGKMIGLHHYGGVDNDPCLNSASMMSLICQDAGGLLVCDGN